MIASRSSPRNTKAASRPRRERLLLVALLIGCACFAVKTIDIARYDAAIVRFPFQVDDAEGVVVAEAGLIAHGTNPYAFQPSPAPYFYAGPYTPVYTTLNAAAIAVAGPTFKFGRALQWLATVAVAVWLAWAVHRAVSRRIGWVLGAWCAGLFFTAHLVVVWSVRVRPDMTALAWNLLGVFVLRAWVDESGDRELWRASAWPRGCDLAALALGAACFALGWWTKQTFIAAPLAFLAVTLLRRPRVAVVLAGLYAVMIALPFLVLTGLTHGGFAQKTIGYQGSWEWTALHRLAEPFVHRYALVLGGALIAAILISLPMRRPAFAVCWLVLSAGFALGAGTSGGNHNHFVELLAASSLILGYGIGVAINRPPRAQQAAWAWTAAAVAAILLLSGVSAFEHEGTAGWLARDYRQPTQGERDGLAAVASYLANAPGPVYSNNVGILVVAGRTVRVTDPFTMAAEVRLGRWDDAELVADVAAGRYAAIALGYNQNVAELNPDLPPTDATPGLIRAIQARYRLVERNVLNIYVPK